MSRSRGMQMPLAVLTCLSALGLWLVAPTSAAGAHFVDDTLSAGATEAEVRAMETATLGAEHAAEHAAARRAARRGLESGNPRAALSSEGVAVRVAGPPVEVGEWTQAPFTLPTYAITSVVLPTGKILFWGRPPRPNGVGTPQNVGEAALWSPWLGTGPGAFKDVVPPVIDPDGAGPQPPGPATLWCGGGSLLASGEAIVAGGNLIYPGTYPSDPYTGFGGLPTIFTFDPYSETWTRQPDMADGRWYPTQVLLADGRTVIAGGYDSEAPGGILTENLEVFNAATSIGGQGTVEQRPSADRALGLYPRLFSLRDDALLVGPAKANTAVLDSTSFTWDESIPAMLRARLAGNAVRRPDGPNGSDVITSIGGYARPPGSGPFFPASETSETIDAGAPGATFTADAPLNVARSNANTVLLPDGSMVVIGGGSGYDDASGAGFVTYADGRARQVELYDPDSNSWVLGPAQQEDRTYHSTAVLLPDGRVFSGGDDQQPEETGDGSIDTAEIYSPPYLFKGPRPVIDSSPQAVNWNDDFGIASDSPGIERAVLVAPGATTHAVDTSQRHVELEVLETIDGEGINVSAPPDTAAAPPGHYMLFLLDATGVPSVASWVKLDPTAPDQPLIGPPQPPDDPIGDFNGDGFADRAVGAPLEDVGSVSDAGVVNIIYGSAAGLAGAGNQVFSQNDLRTSEISSEAGDQFGASLSAGDFNDDGFSDLAAGAPYEDVGPATDAGTVEIVYGSAGGLVPNGEHWNQDRPDIADATESGDRLGAAVAAGDLNGDGRDDLAMGAASESVGTVAGAGAVNVIYGSATGLVSTGNQLWTQNSASILEAADAGDSLGAAVAAGDLNGDAREDLAIGVPSEGVGTTAGAGGVTVIYGSASGLAAAGNQIWHQSSPNIAEAVEAGDAFGAAVATGDLNGDGRDDLSVGVPSESVGTVADSGAVHSIYGSGTGLTATGSQLWTQNSASILEAAETGDALGTAVAAGDLNGDSRDDLAIGVPSESVGATAGAGSVSVIYGSGSGLAAPGNQVWHQGSAGIADAVETGDSLGAALGIGAFDGNGFSDLAIGVPLESLGALSGAGAMNVIYGTGGGLTSTGSQLWSQDSPSILEAAEAGDRFAAALGADAR